MIRSAQRGVLVVAWVLLIMALGVIALNPAVSSLGYALFWLGVMAVARGISMLVSWVAVAVDLALLPVCFLGMEIGGLILVPSIIGFVVADAFDRERVTATQPNLPSAIVWLRIAHQDWTYVFTALGLIASRVARRQVATSQPSLVTRNAPFDVRGSELVAVQPRPNENAWVLGYAYREKLELVGARGFEPPGPTTRIGVPSHIAEALRAVA